MRLAGYDYSRAGAYFVTICVKDYACLFGEVVEGRMVRNVSGEIAARCWEEIPRHFEHVELDAFVVMPNHVHGILLSERHGTGMPVPCLKPCDPLFPAAEPQ